MSVERHLPDHEATKALAERLSARLSYIDRHEKSPANEPPSWTLAQALEHVEGSCIEFQEHLAALVASNDDDSMEAALVELREDLRHILWHTQHAVFPRPGSRCQRGLTG